VPAHEAVSPKQFLYHESHITVRDKVRSEGLKPAVPYNASDLPSGVYLAPLSHSEYSSSMHDATHYGHDRWRVDVTGLDLHTDSSQPSASKFHPGQIPPERLKLAKKGHPNWERHI
jgi:hypothetical protein